MGVRELVQKVLDSARIPRVRCRFEELDRDYVVVEISGDYCSAKLVVVERTDGLVWVQVKAPLTLVKICAPLETLMTDEVLLADIVDAVETTKDWEPVGIDWSVLAEELEDAVAQELC